MAPSYSVEVRRAFFLLAVRVLCGVYCRLSRKPNWLNVP